jgi:hypothetical protein
LALPLETAPDPDLEALPEPRRPGRRLTLVALVLTAAFAVYMLVSLRKDFVFSLDGAEPEALGELGQASAVGAHENRWVHATGMLGTAGAVKYSRPLETDSYRLAPVVNNPSLWVQVRVPGDFEDERFVPPTSFVGRLLSFDSPGLRYRGLAHVLQDTAGVSVPKGAYLLVDGEAPGTTRWALGLGAVFVGFVAFALGGLVRLLRPVRDD